MTEEHEIRCVCHDLMHELFNWHWAEFGIAIRAADFATVSVLEGGAS
jgi:hypothetical protein